MDEEIVLMKIIIVPEAEAKLDEIQDYILNQWGIKSRDTFKKLVFEKSKQISLFPESCERSEKKKKTFTERC